jgi:hypothetical protein
MLRGLFFITWRHVSRRFDGRAGVAVGAFAEAGGGRSAWWGGAQVGAAPDCGRDAVRREDRLPVAIDASQFFPWAVLSIGSSIHGATAASGNAWARYCTNRDAKAKGQTPCPASGCRAFLCDGISQEPKVVAFFNKLQADEATHTLPSAQCGNFAGNIVQHLETY